MKHLNTYKIFENLYKSISDTVQKEADDYLANLKDNGYRISVSSYPLDDDIQVCILISGKRFKWVNVKYDVKRFIEMTNNELDSIVCHNESTQVQTHFSSVNEVPHETEMSFLQLYFNYKDGILESHINYNQSDMVNDLKDMLYDLIDLGFYTRVSEEKGIITVCISRLRSLKGFIRSEEELNTLKELLTRVNEYGKSCDHLVDRTWLARVKNLSDGLMSGRITNYEEFNKLMNDNRCTMYITMCPKYCLPFSHSL